MRTTTVEVPAEVIVEFAAKLCSTSLAHEIKATTEDDQIIFDIFFEKDESDEVDELEEYLQELIDSLPEEDDEEDEEDED